MNAPRVLNRWGALFACVTLVSCATSTVKDQVPTATVDQQEAQFTPEPIEWQECEDGSDVVSITCGTLEVPFDYGQPDRGSFVLHIKKRSATKKAIGPLLVNPGGPGFGGSNLANEAMYYFSKSLLDSFDIIAWDPRGTGLTSPSVDCVDSYDEYFGLDSPPDDEAERQALIDATRAFNDECVKNSGTILPYISTVASARDMNSIRLALDVEKISYFGFSYGSELGATWATLFPDTVRAAVLDGAADPTASSLEQGLAQAEGFEQQLTTFLARCSADATCSFHNAGNAEAAFDRLMVEIDRQPIVVSSSRTPVTQGVAYTAVAQAMYSDYYWPDLQDALFEAQQKRGRGLLDLYDNYYQRREDGTYGNELEAFIAISCLDGHDRPTVDEIDALVERFVKVAPRLGANFGYGFACSLWPVPPVSPFVITGKGAGPIVVIGTTGDAATPLASTRRMAAALENGRLIVVEADQHTGYGANECVILAVDAYLIDLKIPSNPTSCFQ